MLPLMDERQKIIDVVTQLFVGTDRRDWESVKKCLERHVLFDMSSLTGGSPATLTAQQIVEGWDSGLEPIKHVHHQAGNYIIDIKGAEAHAFCYAIAYHYRETKSGRNTRVFVGSYDFDLRRHGDEWKIATFKFNLKFIDGNPQIEQD
jgi:hypothetical protein